MSITILLDGDINAYKAASAVETVACVDEGLGLYTWYASLPDSIDHLTKQMEFIKKTYQPSRIIFALTDPGENWRKAVLPTGLEGDDVLGILATSKSLIEGPAIVVTDDKDLKTIPCQLARMDEDVCIVSEKEADYNHMFQTLTGDTTDGYKGCPGVGPKKATEILFDNPTNVWGAVVKTFEKAKLTEADALVQARVARICRASDYDFQAQRVKLWEPNI